MHKNIENFFERAFSDGACRELRCSRINGRWWASIHEGNSLYQSHDGAIHIAIGFTLEEAMETLDRLLEAQRLFREVAFQVE